jgi:hypothetical protein
VPAVGEVIQNLLFKGDRKIGIVYMEQLVGKDSAGELARLCTRIGAHNPDTAPKLVDVSATSGVPIITIALAGVVVCYLLHRHAITNLHDFKLTHSLNRMYLSDKEKKNCTFSASQYINLWGTYVRALIEHPKLGALCTSMLGYVK